jgi:hypothetical protein
MQPPGIESRPGKPKHDEELITHPLLPVTGLVAKKKQLNHEATFADLLRVEAQSRIVNKQSLKLEIPDKEHNLRSNT